MGRAYKVYLTVGDIDKDMLNFMENMRVDSAKIIRFAMNDTLMRTRSNAIIYASRRYNLRVKSMVDLKSYIKIDLSKKDALYGSVEFRGNVGYPLERFGTSPRGYKSYKGVHPLKRRPAGGVRVKVLKNGPWKKVGDYTDGGSAFWYLHRGKERLLVRENGKAAPHGYYPSAVIHPMGPSPIQALTSKEGEEFVGDYARATFAKRLEHVLDRYMKTGKLK